MCQGRRWLACSVSVLTAVALSYSRPGQAQEAAPGEPAAQLQDSDVAAPPPPAPSGPVVTLRADSPKARLQILGEPLRWRDVCTTPCRVPVAPAGTYRVGGDTIRPSDPFNMPRASGPVAIDAQIGSNVKHWVGVAFIIGGAANVAAGGIYYSNADGLANSSSNTSHMSKSFYQGVGIGGIVTGVVLVAIGIPLALSSTSVEVR